MLQTSCGAVCLTTQRRKVGSGVGHASAVRGGGCTPVAVLVRRPVPALSPPVFDKSHVLVAAQHVPSIHCEHQSLGSHVVLAGDTYRQQAASSSSGHWGNMCSILDHTNVVWLGDLNYRLTCSDEEARRWAGWGRRAGTWP